MKVRPNGTRRSGFTLAEVAVTIVIIGIGLVLILQGLNAAKMTAAHTHNSKLARDLAMVTLGEIESGLYSEEVEDSEDTLSGSYAEQGYQEFYWEVVLGDETFPDLPDEESDRFDSWRPDPYDDDLDEDDEESDEEDEGEPYEKVKIRVTFPPLKDFTNTLIFEKWVPWDQVYGVDEEDEEGADPEAASGGGGDDGGGTPR